MRRKVKQRQKSVKNDQKLVNRRFHGLIDVHPDARCFSPREKERDLSLSLSRSENAKIQRTRRPRCNVIEKRDLASSSGNVGVSQRDHPRV